jgi:phosphomannomutase/phosphoglucomutase|tara:strand:- start:32386 stop:33759 length:1374 start_codon:yes stop_codon:yes gene_type:complete
MNVIESIFREYDIRGTYPSEINENIISLIAQAIALKCKEEGVSQISVGRDGRLSGETLLDSMCSSLARSGISVTNIGLVTSPILYYAAKNSDSKSGIMITGSHNPKDDNGIKMVINNKPVSGTEILSLTKSVLDFNEIKEEIIKLDIIEDYINDVLQKITLDKPENLKVIIDCGNGAAGCVAPELFKRLGCNVINLFPEIDGNFPNHHPDPGKLANLQDLIKSVKSENADLGLAFDGDGDRVGLVTEKGNVVFPDKIMMLFAKDILARNNGGQIIFDVKCSNLLAEIIKTNGGEPIMSPTGHFHIKNKLRETNALLAGEMSGHIFFNDDWYGFDDGHYAGVRIIDLINRSNSSIDEMISELPKSFSTPELNIYASDDSKFDIVKKFAEECSLDGKKITIDGLRIEFSNGWGLLRASNTTPKLVLRFEGSSEIDLNEIQENFMNEFKRICPEIDPTMH